MSDYLDRPSVLIVDDDANTRKAIHSVLEDMDIDVVEAGSGEEALRQVLRHQFTVIALDVGLPGIDGFETAQVIREREKSRDIPIIFLTGLERDQDQVNRGYELDAVDYMLKPINRESFRAKIRFTIQYRRELLASLKKERATANKLGELVEELERSNRELDDFAYTASHDLKEPLRGIAINASFLAREDVSDEARIRIDRMIALTTRMEKLISDILFFSRLGRGQAVMKDLDTKHIIEGIQGELSEWTTELGGEIIVRDGLPWLHAERSKVKTVFQNLIVNGLKYNDSDRKTVEIGFHLKAKVEGVIMHNVFFVRDNGIGIAPGNRDKIFRLFSRLNVEEKYGSGTGAGLSFVRKVVEEYGHKIAFTSRQGTGTTFYFSLPMEDKGSMPPNAASSNSRSL